MFSGLNPKESGRTDNTWQKGEATIKGETIFDIAKSQNYETGFFYSKTKLGYLVNESVDQYGLDKDFSLEMASDTVDLKRYHGINYSVTELKSILKEILNP